MGRLSRRFSFVSCLVLFLSVAWRPTDATNDLSRHPQQSSTKGGGRRLSSISKLDQPRSLEQDARESSSKLERGDSNARDLLVSANNVWKITDALLKQYDNDVQAIIEQTSPGDTLQFQVTKVVQPKQKMSITHELIFTTSPKSKSPYTTFTCPDHGSLMIITSPSFSMTGFRIQNCTTLDPIISVKSEGCKPGTLSVVELIKVIFTNINMKNNKRIFDASPPSCSKVQFEEVDFIDNSCMAVGCVLFPLASEVAGSKVTRNTDNNLRWDNTAVYLVPSGAVSAFIDIDASDNKIPIIYVSAEAAAIVVTSTFDSNSGMGVINGQTSVITIDDCTFTKNIMSGRCGVSWISGSGEIIAKNSVYSHNRGEQGASIMVSDKSSGSIKSCTFADNLAGGNGGALQVTKKSSAVISKSNFYRNNAQYGGAVYVDYNSTVSFDSCKFENQKSNAFGAAIAAYRGSTLRVADTDISGSRGGHGGGIRLEKWVTAFIKSCTFTNNTSVGDGGAINMWIEISISISDSTFSENKAFNGAAVFAAGDSVATIDNTLFVNNSCTDRGAALFITSEHSSAQVTSTNFTGNKGNGRGAVLVQKAASANFTECDFFQNAATYDAGAISAHRSGSVIVSKARFIHNAATNGGALSVTIQSSMKVSDSIVANNSVTQLGGAFRVDDHSSFETSNTKFILNEGKQGGCGKVDRESSAKASNCEFFAHSSTREGGTMMISNSSLTFVDSSVRNSTSGNYGGAVHLVFSKAVANSSYFEYNHAKWGGSFAVSSASNATISDSFINNNEANNGGGIYAKDSSFTEVKNTEFTNNTAIKTGGAICSLTSWLLVGELEVVGSKGAPPGPTITVIGGEYLIDGDSFGFV